MASIAWGCEEKNHPCGLTWRKVRRLLNREIFMVNAAMNGDARTDTVLLRGPHSSTSGG